MGGFLDALPPGLLSGGGFATLALVAVWFIMTGRLVPGKTHDQMRQDRDTWKAAHDVKVEETRVLARQVDKLIDQGQAMERVLTGIQSAIQHDRHDRGRDDRGDRGTGGGRR